MMHQMHERRRGTPDENKNMQQVASAICGSGVAGKDGMAASPGNRNNLNGRTLNGGASTSPYLPQGVPEHLGHPGIGGFPSHSEYQLPPTQKPGSGSAAAGSPGQMYEMAPHFGGFPGQQQQQHSQSLAAASAAFNGHVPPSHDSGRLSVGAGDDGDFPTRHQMMNNRLKTLIQTRQSQKEQGPFQGLETTLGPSVGGNFVHPQADAGRGFSSLARSSNNNGGSGGSVGSNSNNNNSSGSNHHPRPPSSSEVPVDAWREASPSSTAPSRVRTGVAELPEFAKNGSSSSSQGSSSNNNNNSEAEFSQPEDQSRESEFAESGGGVETTATTTTTGGGSGRVGAPPNGMHTYGSFYSTQEAAEVGGKNVVGENKEVVATSTSDGDVRGGSGGGAPYQFTSSASLAHTTTTLSGTVHQKPCNGPPSSPFAERQSPRAGSFPGQTVPTSYASSPHLGHPERTISEGPSQSLSRNSGNDGNGGNQPHTESEPTDTAAPAQQQPFLLNTTTSMSTYTSIISTYNSFAASCAPSFLAEHQPKFGGSSVAEDAVARAGGGASDIDGGRIAVGEFRGLDFAPPPPPPGGVATATTVPDASKSVPGYPLHYGAPVSSAAFTGTEYSPYGTGNPFPLPPMGAGGPPFTPMSLPGTDPWWDRLERLRSNTKAEPPPCDCYGVDETREYRNPRSPSTLPAAM